jgi:hypothetical protein
VLVAVVGATTSVVVLQARVERSTGAMQRPAGGGEFRVRRSTICTAIGATRQSCDTQHRPLHDAGIPQFAGRPRASSRTASCSSFSSQRIAGKGESDMATRPRRERSSTTSRGRAAVKKKAPHASAARGTRRWSARVTRESDALDLEPEVFRKSDPAAIARSLKRSAARSARRKADPFRSAMSMLTFYVNRAGRNLDARRRDILERAKDELRKVFGREPRTTRARKRPAAAH